MGGEATIEKFLDTIRQHQNANWLREAVEEHIQYKRGEIPANVYIFITNFNFLRNKCII